MTLSSIYANITDHSAPAVSWQNNNKRYTSSLLRVPTDFTPDLSRGSLANRWHVQRDTLGARFVRSIASEGSSRSRKVQIASVSRVDSTIRGGKKSETQSDLVSRRDVVSRRKCPLTRDLRCARAALGPICDFRRVHAAVFLPEQLPLAGPPSEAENPRSLVVVRARGCESIERQRDVDESKLNGAARSTADKPCVFPFLFCYHPVERYLAVVTLSRE